MLRLAQLTMLRHSVKMTNLDSIFVEAWTATGLSEGGYSNHADDPGGETIYGITERIARANGYSGPMPLMPPATAREIAREEFWIRPGFDRIAQISPSIAKELFDTNLNLWSGAAAKFLQRSLNILNKGAAIYPDLLVDGKLGPESRACLAAYLKYRAPDGERVLLLALNGLQCAEYIRQAEANEHKEAFVYGWIAKRVHLF